MPKSWVVAIAEREAQLGAAAVADMAKTFVEASKAQLAMIDAAVARHALSEARRTARDLATHAGSLCFNHLRVAAQDFEQACSGDDRVNLSKLAAALAPLVEMTVIQLRARYGLT